MFVVVFTPIMSSLSKFAATLFTGIEHSFFLNMKRCVYVVFIRICLLCRAQTNSWPSSGADYSKTDAVPVALTIVNLLSV